MPALTLTLFFIGRHILTINAQTLLDPRVLRMEVLARLQRLLGPDITVEVGDEAPEREPKGDALGGAERLVEEDDSDHLADRDENGDNHSGEQRRTVEDSADRAKAEALVHGGCAGQEKVVARLTKLGLPGFS